MYKRDDDDNDDENGAVVCVCASDYCNRLSGILYVMRYQRLDQFVY